VNVVIEFTCEYCSFQYVPVTKWQKFCSTECNRLSKLVVNGPGKGRVRKFAPPGMVACSRCDYVGLEETWKKRKTTYKGVTRLTLESWCDACRKEVRLKIYWKDPVSARASSLRWVVENPVQAQWSRRAYLARKRAVTTIPYTLDQLTARLSMFGFRCWMCANLATDIDHVKPLSAGGFDCLSNVRPACKSCNCSKRSTWPYETRLWFRFIAPSSNRARVA
jgi:5-methylcytosine-specific restriction endonuclease McrA